MQPTKPLLWVAALVAISLAGCADETEPTTDLALSSDRASAMESETFHFIAEGDAEVFHFDFGDGITDTVSGEGKAVVEHAYEAGGAYMVTVSADNGSLADATEVYVKESVEHQVKAIAAGPLANETGAANWSIPERDNATGLMTNLSIENSGLIGDARVTLRILDADDMVLVEETIMVPEDSAQDVILETAVSGGAYTIEAIAESGSLRVSGESVISYS